MKKILSMLLVASFLFAGTITPVNAEPVMYNTSNGKIHKLWCRWAKKCTVNCIKIDRKEAEKRGGIPCKVCGG